MRIILLLKIIKIPPVLSCLPFLKKSLKLLTCLTDFNPIPHAFHFIGFDKWNRSEVAAECT